MKVFGRELLAKAPPERRLEELTWDGPKTAMAVFAHPDDADFVCSGTAARWADEGWTVYYVLATSGDKGTHQEGLSRQELAAIREEEQRAAARILGLKDCIFLGYPDGFLEDDDELRGDLVRLFRRYKPDLVITWDAFRPSFNHRDHRNIGIAARDAVYPAVRDHLYYAELSTDGVAPAHKVDEMLLSGTESADGYVNIERYVDAKIDALLCHKSQMGGRTKDDLVKMYRERTPQRPGLPGPFVETFKQVRMRR